MAKMISTTALAKKYNMTSKEMFLLLLNYCYIEKKGELWSLTNLGVDHGGKFVDSKKFGKYITWPEDIVLHIEKQTDTKAPTFYTSTSLGKQFGISAKKTNAILSELGWIFKQMKGWVVTPQGIQQGGLQDEDKRTGIPYVRWNEKIISSKILLATIEDVQGSSSKQNSNAEQAQDTPETTPAEKSTKEPVEFREKFKAEHRSTDGHFVRSKAEMLIDNWLYMAEIVHAYERKLPIEEDVYSDFYIPTGKVYIEYWGYEDNPKYLQRKKVKQDIYEKYGFKLIELNDKDVLNLDDVLPRLLLKHGIQTY